MVVMRRQPIDHRSGDAMAVMSGCLVRALLISYRGPIRAAPVLTGRR